MTTLLDIILTIFTGGLWLIVVFIRKLHWTKQISKELRKMRKEL